MIILWLGSAMSAVYLSPPSDVRVSVPSGHEKCEAELKEKKEEEEEEEAKIEEEELEAETGFWPRTRAGLLRRQ